MGQKKKAEESKNEAAKAESEEKKEEKKEEEKEEDTPFVKELKELDDQYLTLEKEYEQKVRDIQKEYEAKQKPLLESRAKKLAEGDAKDSGTPGCPGFWLEAMNNYPYMSDIIREWDEPVLKYLKDIKCMDLESDPKGNSSRIELHFAENPYFSNDILWKEVRQDEENAWTGEQETKSIKCCDIEWKAGKDVTVEKKEKKVKGGGAKKAKQKGKVSEEPRDSFFRLFFRSVDPESDDVPYVGEEMEGIEEDEDIMEYVLDQDTEMVQHMKNYFVPFAVRFYTGEAEMEEDDDDDDDEEEEEEDDDDDDDDDSDEEPAPKKKGGAKKGKTPSDDKSGDKKEECKQQ